MTQRFYLHPAESETGSRHRVLENCIRYLQELPENKGQVVEIKRLVKKRTDSQNNALFGVAYPPLREATGHTLEELHEIFCIKFFGPREIEFNGQAMTRPRRTTTTNEAGKRDVIDTKTFSDFYDLVQQEAAEIGVQVDDPDPMHGRVA